MNISAICLSLLSPRESMGTSVPSVACVGIERRRCAAFSLIELLSVMAVLSLMSVLVLGGVGSSESAKFTSQCWEVTSLLENAREFAKAKRTYVWVGVTKIPEDSLLVSIHSSVSGASSLAADNLMLAHKPVVLSGIGISDQLAASPNPADLLETSDLGSLNVTVAGKNYAVSDLMEFAPDGSARVLAASGQSTIGIPLVLLKGGKQLPGQESDILVSRLTANVELVRK